MSKKSVPEKGEFFAPGTLRTKTVKVGYAATNDVQVTTTGTYKLFTAQDGILVTNVICNKRTAFDSTGAFQFKIGDSDDDGYWPYSDLVASDAGVKNLNAWYSTAATAGPAYKMGRYYATGDDSFDISLVLTVAKINAGQMDVILQYIDRNQEPS